MATAKQQWVADNVMKNIHQDLLAMARNPSLHADADWTGALACNLRVLANLVDQGVLPDPFPYLRHE